ncbi:FIG4 -like proteinlike [Caligus rogercresseyi]|uniref:FIG4 -like proteinlike n=1 Tax=Caligus rogercresseyi TaxID=217165 RepID=A0A7T8KJH0_CALRO|nr:FIG4 -like proteinlike [Caligus rogercresseyi]
MVPKPPIYVELSDPLAISCGRHFDELLQRFGAPVICVNLVKKESKSKRRKHESILTDELTKSIAYLNQFLPSAHRLQYFISTWQSAGRGDDFTNYILYFNLHPHLLFFSSENNLVMHHLHEISYQALAKTGIYHNKNGYNWYKNKPENRYFKFFESFRNLVV